VKDRLHTSARASGGQRQRLHRAGVAVGRRSSSCRTRLALDPIATQRIEELIYQLKARHTIVIVTHNMQQAARVGRRVLLAFSSWSATGRTRFTAPAQKPTEDYVTGRFG
jgi:phosphate transport system ATP-binding protein